MDPVTTLIADDESGAVVKDVLRTLGYDLQRPHRTLRTRLDTFDGRLQRAGMRLEIRESTERTLHLTGRNLVPVAARIDEPPTRTDDLPPGPMRDRLQSIVDDRALRPMISFRASVTLATRRDRRDKIVASVALYERLRCGALATRPAPCCLVEIDELPGYAKHTNETIDALRRLGLTTSNLDPLGALAALAGIDLAGFDSSPAVPLTAGADAAISTALVLANLASVVAANWQGAIDQTDTEFLHELRVAVRRSRSVLRAASDVLPIDLSRHGRTIMRTLSSATGPARDLDVQLSEWRLLPASLGDDAARDLEPLHDLLQRHHRDAHTQLAAALRDPTVVAAFASWRRDLGTLDAGTASSGSGPSIGPMIDAHITRAHRRLVTRGRRIDDTTPAERVHDLRKDAKLLRYLVECFATLLDDTPRKRFLRRLKPLQDVLGTHQDADVQCTELATHASQLHTAGAGPATMMAIGRLDATLRARRDLARDEFADRFEEFDSPATRAALAAALRRATR
jgi:CHAD domain-containing protein